MPITWASFQCCHIDIADKNLSNMEIRSKGLFWWFVQKIMCRNHFLSISRFLYFGDNDETYNDRLGKFKCLVDHLTDTIRDIYVSEDRHLCYGGLPYISPIYKKLTAQV